MNPNSLPAARPSRLVRALLVSLIGTAGAVLSASVAAWKDVQFGGFVSQGFLVNTGHNDYLGDTSAGTFDLREYAVNASYAKGQWRIGAQAFGQKLGAYGGDRIALDWASIDCQPALWFGFRVGRVKTPRGLYNEALDLDSIRPFVLLPQSVYDARLRSFNAAFNGGMVFGNASLKRFGSVDYRAYYGDIPLSTTSGASAYFNNDVPYDNAKIGMDATYGGSLFWNTPIRGFRAGYSYVAFKNFTAARIVIRPTIKTIADRGTRLYGRHLLSLEYMGGDWTFALEAGKDTAFYNIVGNSGAFRATQDFKARYAYASVSRRLNDRFEVGAYYSYSKDVLTGQAAYNLTQGDYAVSVRYDVNEHLLFKFEAHAMDGSGKLFNTAAHPQPVAGRDNSWFLFGVKTTYSF